LVRETFLVAVHVFFLREGRVLLSRRYQTGYEDGNYSVPAGHLEVGEPVTGCARREVREEIGLALEPAALRMAHVMHRKSDSERIDFFFVVENWVGEPANCEPDKCDELAWYPLDALPPNTIPYVRHALHMVQHHVPFSEFGWR
jgi:8-oxo-dGTP diphosphatase